MENKNFTEAFEIGRFKYPSVLSIAGFDGSGGAGIQADIKTVSSLGCYALSVLTSLPVQNTQGVKKNYPISSDAVKEQLDAIFEDIRPDVIKIGMVHQQTIVQAIADMLRIYPDIPVVLDPVMISSSGHKLIEDDTVAAIKKELFPLSAIITPNLNEASVLSGISVNEATQMREAAEIIQRHGARNILIKGGHLEESVLSSFFLDENGNIEILRSQRCNTKNTHGTGCTLSSAIASYLALGNDLQNSVLLAQKYIERAIDSGKDVITGLGNGPVNHFFNPQRLVKNEVV